MFGTILPLRPAGNGGNGRFAEPPIGSTAMFMRSHRADGSLRVRAASRRACNQPDAAECSSVGEARDIRTAANRP